MWKVGTERKEMKVTADWAFLSDFCDKNRTISSFFHPSPLADPLATSSFSTFRFPFPYPFRSIAVCPSSDGDDVGDFGVDFHLHVYVAAGFGFGLVWFWVGFEFPPVIFLWFLAPFWLQKWVRQLQSQRRAKIPQLDSSSRQAKEK